MIMLTLIAFGTLVMGGLAAWAVARLCRSPRDRMRMLADAGYARHQIAKQLNLPQDVIEMVLGTPPTSPRRPAAAQITPATAAATAPAPRLQLVGAAGRR
jgi:hypothetical protein